MYRSRPFHSRKIMRPYCFLALLATLGCLAAPARRYRQQVPAVSPDSEPAWLAADSALSQSGYWKRIVLVSFRASATQGQRQAAIDRIGGSVVGGIRGVGPDGFYIVYIPKAETSVALGEAIARLKTLPQVDLASLAWTGDVTSAPIRIRGPSPASATMPPNLPLQLTNAPRIIIQ
jgi:hypothetical protein